MVFHDMALLGLCLELSFNDDSSIKASSALYRFKAMLIVSLIFSKPAVIFLWGELWLLFWREVSIP